MMSKGLLEIEGLADRARILLEQCESAWPMRQILDGRCECPSCLWHRAVADLLREASRG